eukprot:CAMPEP_0198116158 /NCGR_PEP_ID=MMETSP1442-20131203/9875_1 /TAXON_ID= /ORGANISM="Craspedostauros australis, Strain CCMP3328" /LENGTH=270 /DNA_ID=CAMNT_0043773873 /DNA_START=280 /DNA_END=1092 /DNA_ORIENTATION=-
MDQFLPSGFPYDRLPTAETLTAAGHNTYFSSLAFLFRPEGVVVMIIFYLLSKQLVKHIAFQSQQSLQNFVAAHNLILAVFSGVVAINGIAAIIQHTFQYGAFATYCDNDSTLWNEAGFGGWAIVFYISKFYEFIDTWILIWKQKKPSFLQVYHHTGVTVAMWMCVVTHCSALTFFVSLNSIIHTMMYSYFFVKTIWPKAEIKIAKYLTMAQIGQFFTGILGSSGIFLLGDRCGTSGSRVALAFMDTYVIGLVVLFFAFAKKKYNKNGKKE